MKCIAAVVMVALIAAVQGSALIPSVYSIPGTTVVQQNVAPRYVAAYSAPAIAYANHAAYSAPAVTYASHAAVPVSYAAHSSVVQAAPVAYAAPTAYAWDQGHYVHAAPAVYAHVQKEASYVAATRGAVHTAPLPGHAINQKSLNVEPAPGTL